METRDRLVELQHLYPVLCPEVSVFRSVVRVDVRLVLCAFNLFSPVLVSRLTCDACGVLDMGVRSVRLNF